MSFVKSTRPDDEPMKIYVATSWRNTHQPDIVKALRSDGHTVYDFRAPYPGYNGFSWKEVDPNWQNWTTEEYSKGLEHPVAREGFESDMEGLIGADLCILVLPSGRSASWEYGYHCGMTGWSGIVHIPEKVEPELMYSGSRFTSTLPELLRETQSYKKEVMEKYLEKGCCR